MANLFTPSLEGDGIDFSFFHCLWNKNRNEEQNERLGRGSKAEGDKDLALRLPDTVVFQLGQPLRWYFTSEREKHPLILRKRKQNLSAAKIEQEFLRKTRLRRKSLDQSDLVAYFIASDRKSINLESTENDEADNFNGCGIEYFNEEGLRHFLHKRKGNKTGILQRFLHPSGGGNYNSQIRAICTSNVCLLERRKTKQSLQDYRFGLYERAVTFDGPEVYSVSLPVRGPALSGKLTKLCKKVLDDLSEKSNRNSRMKVNEKVGGKEEFRIVLHLKIDSKDRVHVLYSTSIRSGPGSGKFLPCEGSCESSRSVAEPLNIESVIKLSPKIKLTQNANHDPKVKISNQLEFLSCSSCAQVHPGETFHPVPYKTIISHHEKVLQTVKQTSEHWPPSFEMIKCAGGVGFGTMEDPTVCFDSEEREKRDNEIPEKDIIPPVIQHLHKRLNVEAYKRYRTDPLFLNKHCNVCEECFLSYAKLTSTSFQITRPIPIDKDIKQLGFASLNKSKTTEYSTMLSASNKSEKRKKMKKKEARNLTTYNGLFAQGPGLPPAIVDPLAIEKEEEHQAKQHEEDLENLMPLPYSTIESKHQPLMHLLKMDLELNRAKISESNSKQRKAKLNPYEVPLTFVDISSQYPKLRKKKKNHAEKKPLKATTDEVDHVGELHSDDSKRIQKEMLIEALRKLDEESDIHLFQSFSS